MAETHADGLLSNMVGGVGLVKTGVVPRFDEENFKVFLMKFDRANMASPFRCLCSWIQNGGSITIKGVTENEEVAMFLEGEVYGTKYGAVFLPHGSMHVQ